MTNSYIHEQNIKHLLPFFFHDIKKYTVDNSKLGRTIEIDGLSESFNKKQLLVVESKYRDKDISLEVLEHLKESASIFENYETKIYYLISKKGFADNIKNIDDDNVKLVTLSQMLSEFR